MTLWRDKELRSIDPATLEMIEKAHADGCRTAFDRSETTKACPIGSEGSCCKMCAMGPCRVPLAKGKQETPEEKRQGQVYAGPQPRLSVPVTSCV